MANVTLCRICLESGATISIFEGREKDDSVFSKLCLCLNEEIADIEGYPRNICNLCQITLNSVIKFIKKYRESCKLIEKSLIKVKQEVIEIDTECNSNDHDYDTNDYNENVQPKAEIDTQYFIELLKPNDLTIKIKTESGKSKAKSNKKKKKDVPVKKKIGKNEVKKKALCKNMPNAIAASILEGVYVWNGDYWRTSEEHESEKQGKVKQEKQKPLQNLPVLDKTHKKPLPKLCDLCGKTFPNQDRLKQHKNRSHTARTKLPCPDCPKSFLSNYLLSNHIKRVHNENKDKICSACGKAFAFTKDLNFHYKTVHLRIRRIKKDFPCSICKKNYSCAKSVLIHERSVHTGERPAVCTVCNASFYHEDYLKEHMRLHTGQTPYKCPICGRGYAQRGNMKSHIRHNHRLADLDPITLSTIKPSYLKHLKV